MQCIGINVSSTYLQLGKPKDCIDLLKTSMPLGGNDLISKYSDECLQYIESCAYATQGNFVNSLVNAINNVNSLAKIIPQNHTILAAVHNQLGVI